MSGIVISIKPASLPSSLRSLLTWSVTWPVTSGRRITSRAVQLVERGSPARPIPGPAIPSP